MSAATAARKAVSAIPCGTDTSAFFRRPRSGCLSNSSERMQVATLLWNRSARFGAITSPSSRVTRCSTHDDAEEIAPLSGSGSTTCCAEFWTELAASTMKPASCRAVTRLRRSACGFGDTPLTASCNRPSSASSPSRNASSAASARGERSRARAAHALAHRAAPPRRSFAVDGLRPSRLRIRPSAWSSSSDPWRIIRRRASAASAIERTTSCLSNVAWCRSGAVWKPKGSRMAAGKVPKWYESAPSRGLLGAFTGRYRGMGGLRDGL